MLSYKSIFQNLQIGILTLVTKFKNYFQRNIKKPKLGFTQSDSIALDIYFMGLASIPFLIGGSLYLILKNKLHNLALFFLFLGGGITFGLEALIVIFNVLIKVKVPNLD